MEKITFIETENVENKILINKEDIEKAIYLPNCVIIDKEKIDEFKNKFGIDLIELLKKGESIGHIKERFEEAGNCDIIDEIEDFIDNLPYLPQCCDSIYCEDIILQEDLEAIDGLIYDKEADVLSLPENFKDEMEDYYIYWDGKNHRCLRIIDIKELEVEEIDKEDIKKELQIKEIEEKLTPYTAYYDYYKTYYNNQPIYFRIYFSLYQGELPFLDEEWEYTDYELLEAVFYNCVPYKELQKINFPKSGANALWYEINNKLESYLLKHKEIKPFSVKFLTDREHKLLFVDLSSLKTKEYISFVNILNKLGYILDFTKCCHNGVALIEKKDIK